MSKWTEALWSDAQLDALEQFGGVIPHAELGKMIGKTAAAVESKLARFKGRACKHFEELLVVGAVSRPTFYGKRKFTTYRRSAA